MLKDRLSLLEKELSSHTKECGKLYFKIVTGQPTQEELKHYELMKAKLSDIESDVKIVKQMILDSED